MGSPLSIFLYLILGKIFILSPRQQNLVQLQSKKVFDTKWTTRKISLFGMTDG
jgi:hypothetical protein